MSNEYLETLSKNIRYKKEYVGNDTYRLYIKKNDIEFLEKEIQRLEQIGNVNPSEALKGLKHIKKYYVPQPCSAKTYDYLEIIEQALLKAQEQEKVLSIIKEKNVDIKLLKLSTTWLDYYTRVKHKTGYDTELIEEEFDLLKRWLG